MDALVNYGSDDESSDKYLENKVVKGEEVKAAGRSLIDTIEDVNYDNVQMDMSEESDAGQRHKGGGDANRSSSTSSCRSSSSENEDGQPDQRNRHSSSIIHDVKKTRECRGEQEGGGYGEDRHKKKEESRKEESRHRRKGRRSRSKERSGKSRDSKEKERDRRRHASSRDDPHNFESSPKDVSRSSNREDSSRRSRSRDRLGYRHHSDRRRSRSRSPHHRHHRRSHHHRHREESERSSRCNRRSSRGHSPSKIHSGDESRSTETKKATDVSRAVAAAAANIAAAVAATEAVQSTTPLKNEGSGQTNVDGAENGDQQSGNTKKIHQAPLEGLGLQVEGSISKGSLTSLSGNMVTPQQLMVQRSLEAQTSHSVTGIQFPAYYNPAAMNPLKYAEQMQKRRKLWGGNKDVSKETNSTTSGTTSGSTNNWESTTFAQDQDGKLSAKFKRLMGIKSGGGGGVGTSTGTPGQSEGSSQPNDVIKKQEELFSTMERQYEAARLATHTLRGVGLGFGSSSTYQYPR